MSNHLYKYIANIILDYFLDQGVPEGERYNLYLEDQNQVEQLYAQLEKNNVAKKDVFNYKHPEGGSATYSTYTLNINGTKLIVASSQNATEDFFTTLRNEVSNQKELFKGTAILIIFSGKLDSLLGGSGSLTKEGMPLHHNVFKTNIRKDISSSKSLSIGEKEILNIIIDQKTQSAVEDNNTIFDYESVVNCLEKNKIEKEDYKQLGLFPHESLNEYSEKKVRTSSIYDNIEKFEEYEEIHQHGNPQKDFDNKVIDAGKKELSSSEWFLNDFEKVKSWIDKKKDTTPPEIINFTNTLPFGDVWPKENASSKSGRRTQNILVFNPANSYPYTIQAEFDKSLGSHTVRCKRNENIDASYGSKKLVITISGAALEDQLRYVEVEDKSSLGKKYTLNIIEVPWDPNVLNEFKAKFSIDRKKQLLLLEESDPMTFNPGGEEEQLNIEEDKDFLIGNDQTINLKVDYESLESDDLVQFKLSHKDFTLNVGVKPQISVPHLITGIDVGKEKRHYQDNFKYSIEGDTFKISFKHNEHTVRGEFRKNLLLEIKVIESDGMSWYEKSDQDIHERPIQISKEIVVSYNQLINYFKEKETLPSLVYMSEELKVLAQNYIDTYFNELKSIKENSPLTAGQRDLLWLAVIKEKFDEELVKLTPLHPINLAYQLELNNHLGKEDIYTAILKKLNPNSHVPYIKGDGNKTYMIVESDDSPEWIYYTEYLDSKQSTPKHFVSKVIRNKIESFTKNFEFLFSQSNLSPIKLNVVNMGECLEVVQGIFDYYRAYLNDKKDRKLSDLLSIDINIYGSEKLVTTFEEITYYKHVDELEVALKIKLDTKNFGKEDLLNAFLEKINFYTKKFPSKNKPYEYAHVTFYQFDNTKRETQNQRIDQVNTGLALNGLLSDVPTMPVGEAYRSGFGTTHLPETKNQLTELTCLQNAFVNVAPGGSDYESDKVLCKSIDLNIKSELENLYEHSQWVTFVDPKVDLDFFKDNDNLVIIHYTDQYTSSGGFDAITVSDKSKQYEDIVSEFLKKHQVNNEDDSDVRSVINFFNAINGDWLLKLIRRDDQFPREKISLLSGIKSSLALLYHPDIIWVPISLEEILRISGNVGLKSTEGLFSTKNLNPSDKSFSDDLLMIGLQQVGGQLEMYLYPVELKIGGKGLASKGVGQGKRTADLLYKYLDLDNFKGEFYKNFFAKLAIVSAEKLKLYGIWDSQKWSLVTNHYRSDLMNNNFILSKRMWNPIGKFCLIHFESGFLGLKLKKEDYHVHVEFPESEGYNFLLRPIDSLIDLFHNKPTGIDRSLLLANMDSSGEVEDYIDIEPEEEEEEQIEEIQQEKETEVEPERITDKKVKANELFSSNTGEGIDILFGTNLNNGKEVIWEPNNTDKVMHPNTGIIGTMGTGKTQFTKSLISQMSWDANKNVGDKPLGVLIFDYKGDYIKDEFVKALDAKVYNPYHLPYNPLALDATPKSKPMLPLHTANDLKETISNAFNLGNVQKQRLRDVIVQAYESQGIYKNKKDTWTKPPPTLGDVCDIYMQDENVAQDSLYSAISNLQDFEVFEPDVSKTKSLYDLIDGVVVINLSGYDESIQNLIVAITLDAFYTQMQTHGHSIIVGKMRQLSKVILVDEADNFLSKNFNSIKKILKEGREFGVGTILSTQFLNHFSTSENDYSNYILTWVIHRVSEIKTKEVEALFSIESKEQRDQLIKTIKGLEKHHSIVNLAGSEPLLIKDKAFWELIK